MTAICFPSFGLGMSALALVSERKAYTTIELALKSGIRYFDTAALHGDGQAEVWLGHALRNTPEDVIVSTKCGWYRDFGNPPPFQSGQADIWDFSEKKTRLSVDLLSERLNQSFLDIVFLHDTKENIYQAFFEALPVSRELQANNRIGMIGVRCNTVDALLTSLEAGITDVLLIAERWTLLDRTVGLELLLLANSRNTNIIVGEVLNSGCLAQHDNASAKFNYRPISRIEQCKFRELCTLINKYTSLMAVALQFPNRDPCVSVTLLGVSEADQLRGSFRFLDQVIPDMFWQEVEGMGLKA